MNKNVLSVTILSLSAGLFAWGFYSFEKYNFTPGAQEKAPSRWPAAVEAKLLNQDVPTLLVFVHPKCSCTRATLAELAKIQDKTKAQLKTEIFIAVDDAETENEIAAAEERVKKTVGGDIARDQEGRLARTFGAKTSGQTFLYSPKGELLFQGGITESRGHEGDNIGSDEILRLVLKNQEQTKLIGQTPTFGCKL